MLIKLPEVPQGSRIGILGGSFDPPHLGHPTLALAALATHSLDQIWVIPCKEHPFSKKLTVFEHRFKMSQYAFRRIRDVEVLDIERHLPIPNHTYITLMEILKLRPDLDLSLILGSDLLEGLSTWKQAKELQKMFKIYVFDRASLCPSMSSTNIREMAFQGFYEHLDVAVQAYIRKKRLYRS